MGNEFEKELFEKESWIDIKFINLSKKLPPKYHEALYHMIKLPENIWFSGIDWFDLLKKWVINEDVWKKFCSIFEDDSQAINDLVVYLKENKHLLNTSKIQEKIDNQTANVLAKAELALAEASFVDWRNFWDNE